MRPDGHHRQQDADDPDGDADAASELVTGMLVPGMNLYFRHTLAVFVQPMLKARDSTRTRRRLETKPGAHVPLSSLSISPAVEFPDQLWRTLLGLMRDLRECGSC
jgi:hypothetical protein